eukprot:CAMPEP_0195507268 /NCGR_PEP_ID=MMETSP0794_2-20130614/749_1 /TAXON_ID=515487 /ORGANISM="Stephanopyxis turris, Strain CCMP 815" /LENGTH=459 /DNA_ID=CAMNT_0040633897 /DNA_START=67 /DNA_END=1446 /DNA_ORIENTATION=+
MELYAIVLALVGFVDAMSFMIVSPSLVFYVLQQGGTQDQYGVILSCYSLASFLAKPFLGAWSDSSGFRVPFMATQALSVVGGILYLLASVVNQDGGGAVWTIMVGRVLGGIGAANTTLGFIYVARALPQDEQTKMNSLLGTVRLVGMALGPVMNFFVKDVNFSVESFHFDELNSVGVVLMVSNFLTMALVYFFLDEVSSEAAPKNDRSGDKEEEDEQLSTTELMQAISSPDLFIYLFSMFSFMSGFQLIETAFAPAASDALGWGPFEVSVVLGGISVVIAGTTMVVFQLSSKKVRDESLMTFGLIAGAVSYLFMYFCWFHDAPIWIFVLPMITGASCFPFMNGPMRSLFTEVVNSKPALAHHQGKMQSVLSMSGNLASFAAPALITKYVLREPEEVKASADQRELTWLGLFTVVLSLMSLSGHLFAVSRKESRVDAKNVDENNKPNLPNETTSLMGDGV